jgi:hypothetical protein
MIAVDGEKKVLAHYAAAVSNVQIDGRVFQCGQNLDIFSVKQPGSVQHRLYIKTVNKFFEAFGAQDRLPLLYGFPGKRALRIGQMKLGYGDSIPVWVGIRRVSNRRLIWRKIPERNTCDLESVVRLWERVSQRYRVSITRNKDYIQHRYIDRPDNKYTYILIGGGSGARAWSVLKIGKNLAKLVDLIWDGEDTASLTTLDQEACRLARQAGAKHIRMWLSGDDMAKEVLESAGWEFSEHPNQVLVARSFHPEINSGDFIKRFYYTLGDSDMV